MKAVIATDVIFILIFIGLVIGASAIVFWKWYSGNSTLANEFTCRAKQGSYCSDLIAGKSPNWDDIPPKTGCDKFNIVQPTKDQCEKVV